ncbi:hypothetical protein [Staphylococcus equorum]|uniref:hypothetical protein n=1 Tax=Staphylococcus equorum TaxID=246432 RepID=UPI0037D9C97F
MKKFAVIHFISGESIDLYEDTFIETVNNISGPDNFYTQVMFSGSLFDENFSMKKVNPSKPKLGLLGMFSDSDFFTVDEVKKVYYKSSSIHSINFY